ncbi:MAG: ABC transporter permease, partial [Planctomycetes bacterium]|nr:ABC transporter permease [Planctomycetota bacterium]
FRHLWIFILTVTMAPMFIFIYFLITETSQPHYDVLVINQDTGVETGSTRVNHGELLAQSSQLLIPDSLDVPLTITIAKDQTNAIEQLKNRKADALIIIPENFSCQIHQINESTNTDPATIEFVGDLTNLDYMITAVFANEILTDYLVLTTQIPRPVRIKETSLGLSGSINDFDLLVPGLLILSIIMLMFSASIALITEVENKTIFRLKLSNISALEFLTGVGLVQVLIGLIAI